MSRLVSVSREWAERFEDRAGVGVVDMLDALGAFVGVLLVFGAVGVGLVLLT